MLSFVYDSLLVLFREDSKKKPEQGAVVMVGTITTASVDVNLARKDPEYHSKVSQVWRTP